MENILNILDLAIKRLVSPVAMLVAAAILMRGRDNLESIPQLTKFMIILLVLSAFSYTLVSLYSSVYKFQDIGYSKLYLYIFTILFGAIYAVMFFSAISIGLIF